VTDAAALAQAPRILPELDDLNRAYWTGGRNGELLILRDHKTGHWIHPPERVALDARDSVEPAPVSGKGLVFTFTVNHHRFHPEVPVPYVIALIELAEQAGLRVPANVVNCDPGDVYIGMPVRVRFEPRGDIFIPVFEPDV
jgi:uncharacterized OB-fold protein